PTRRSSDLVITGNFAQHNEFFRRNFPAGYARHNGVSTVFLHIAEENIVGVLQADVVILQNVIIVIRRQNGADGGFADFTTMATAMVFQHAAEGFISFYANNIGQLSTAECKVLTKMVGYHHAQRG